MNIIICDDDKVYADSIKNNVELFMNENDIDADFSVYNECSGLIAEKPEFYDIAFLDIEMGEVRGTHVAAELKKVNPHIIIFFITSYDKYLDEAMDLNVFRYIRKPLDGMRLRAGLEKAMDLLDKTMVEFYLKNNNEIRKVASGDIIFIEIKGHMTRLVTVDGEYISKNKMRYWKEQLSATNFFQVHSSFLINSKYITTYVRDCVTLDGRYDIPIAYRTQSSFRKYFISQNSGR